MSLSNPPLCEIRGDPGGVSLNAGSVSRSGTSRMARTAAPIIMIVRTFNCEPPDLGPPLQKGNWTRSGYRSIGLLLSSVLIVSCGSQLGAVDRVPETRAPLTANPDTSAYGPSGNRSYDIAAVSFTNTTQQRVTISALAVQASSGIVIEQSFLEGSQYGSNGPRVGMELTPLQWPDGKIVSALALPVMVKPGGELAVVVRARVSGPQASGIVHSVTLSYASGGVRYQSQYRIDTVLCFSLSVPSCGSFLAMLPAGSVAPRTSI